MLTLYYKPTCPFCRKTIDAIEELGLEVDMKNIVASDDIAAALIELGGKRQVPFLVDTDHDLKMYESDDIIAHLREHHAGGAGKPPSEGITVHKSDDSSCEVCEG